MTEDAQSAAGFVGQLCYVVSPGKVMAYDEAQKFKRLNFFQWMTKEFVFLDLFDNHSEVMGEML